MEQQEDIIKIRSEHYNEYGYQSIQNRQATPFLQCTQTLHESSTAKSPSSPEYSRASSEDTEESETDDSDTSSDTTEQFAWSVSSGSSDEETEE